MTRIRFCVACGKTLVGRAPYHVNDFCRAGYLEHRYHQLCVEEGPCVRWTGAFNKTVPILRFGELGKSKEIGVRPFIYKRLADPDETGTRFEATCENHWCVAVRHMEPMLPVRQQPTLPLAPILDFADRRGIELPAHDMYHAYQQAERHSGQVSITCADRLCINLLGLHPFFIYGDLFYTVGMEDESAERAA